MHHPEIGCELRSSGLSRVASATMAHKSNPYKKAKSSQMAEDLMLCTLQVSLEVEEEAHTSFAEETPSNASTIKMKRSTEQDVLR
eukprot:Skav227722  [mRNA]  locus=scaffold802:135113:136110:+ [translate_table: standard]